MFTGGSDVTVSSIIRQTLAAARRRVAVPYAVTAIGAPHETHRVRVVSGLAVEGFPGQHDVILFYLLRTDTLFSQARPSKHSASAGPVSGSQSQCQTSVRTRWTSLSAIR
jgi:hypothetical protein